MGLENLKEFIEKAEDKIKNDPDLKEEFKADPVKTIEKVLGVDLPDEQVKAIAGAVKAKVEGGAEGVSGAVSHLVGEIGGLFHHKDK